MMKTLLIRYILLVTGLLCISCGQESDAFRILSPEQTGISFVNRIENTPELNILNYLYFYNGGGVAAIDVNMDGLQDLYFTANQGPDKLYLNLGGMTFSDITTLTGINNNSGWTTGVSVADIDHNGYPDIYLSKVAPLGPEGTHNLLFLNEGPNKNGIPVFREASAEFGIDFKGYSTQAAFFDQDLDGDLDMYLLNHSVHPNQNYGRGQLRDRTDSLSGDRFYRNNNGKFIDESVSTGVHTGKIGYGLGIAVNDLDLDGYPDLYIGNDFFENDYLYHNLGNGNYTDLNETNSPLGHTSHYSMGADIADINNDGNPDIISVDMLPEDLHTYKTSGLEFPYHIYQNYLRQGYSPQFMQNTLHMNHGNNTYSEVAFLSGIAATEWSWSPVIADLDNDGLRDLYVTNGIPGATNDMDFVSFIANEEIQRRLGDSMGVAEMEFIDKLPPKNTPNYLFRNLGENRFEQNSDWGPQPASFSHGAVAADLDNDGDLDLVVNNVNSEAFIIQNNNTTHTGLCITFKGDSLNTMGIGARVMAYFPDHTTITAQNFPSRGYLSSQPATVHLGLGSQQPDSLQVWWPDGRTQVLHTTGETTQITLNHSNSSKALLQTSPKPFLWFEAMAFPADITHRDPQTTEFNRDPLVPYASTNSGGKVNVGDLNGDQLDDLVFGGGKFQSPVIFYQQEGTFIKDSLPLDEEESRAEQTDQLLFDADGDGQNDLLLVHGGNEFTEGPPLQPRLYLRKEAKFTLLPTAFEGVALNASRVRAVDLDGDRDLDLCITADLLPHRFGETPKQYLLENDGQGNFTDITAAFAPELEYAGNIKDQVWTDLNGDQLPDLIVVGHWMPPMVFLHTGKGLKKQSSNGLDQAAGWWNTLETADLDGDGDTDLVAGNWGLNTRLKASKDHPLTLYRHDLDNNGNQESLVTYFYKDTETPFASKDELSKQLPFLNKEYLSYNRFAKAGLEELFSEGQLDKAMKKQVFELGSCWFENLGNGNFKKHLLPPEAQNSAIFDIHLDDIDGDGSTDIFLVGNLYEISTQLGRQDANRGTILLQKETRQYTAAGNAGITGAMRSVAPVNINGDSHLLITRNNDKPILLKPLKADRP